VNSFKPGQLVGRAQVAGYCYCIRLEEIDGFDPELIDLTYDFIGLYLRQNEQHAAYGDVLAGDKLLLIQNSVLRPY